MARNTGSTPEEPVETVASVKPDTSDHSPRAVDGGQGYQVTVSGQGIDMSVYDSLIHLVLPDGTTTTARQETDGRHCFPDNPENPDAPIFAPENIPTVRIFSGSSKEGPWQEISRDQANGCGQVVTPINLAGPGYSCGGYLRMIASYSAPPSDPAYPGTTGGKTYFRADKILGCHELGIEEGAYFPGSHYLVKLALRKSELTPLKIMSGALAQGIGLP